jgi:phosphate starvation-inducible PhoH-like protein
MKTKNLEKLGKGGAKGEAPRKSRKARKQYADELCEFYNECDTNNYIETQTNYSNYEHLSSNEKEQFETMFSKPKNESQKKYLNILKNKEKKIVVVTGPAGTGKTLFATEQGVKQFLKGGCEKLIFTRPSVSVDEDLGYLPGTLEEKMAPWVRPIYDILHNFMSSKEISSLIEEKEIEISPLGHMRGRTFKNCWIIADEMQNSTINQMKMLLTRIGENSRIILTGDLEQFDNGHQANGLDDFLNKFKGKRSSSITSIEFESSDIQREEVVKEVLDIYDAEVIPPSYNLEYDSNSDSGLKTSEED